MASIHEQLDLLERRCRRTERAAVMAVSLMIGLVCVAATWARPDGTLTESVSETQQQRPKTPPNSHGMEAEPATPRQDDARVVEAERFVLRDASDRVRATLAIENGGAVLAMFDEEGSRRIECAQVDLRAEVALLATDGTRTVAIHTDTGHGTGQVDVFGNHSRMTATSAGVSINDAHDDQRLLMKLINGNHAVLGVSGRGQQGPPSVEITAGDDGSRKLAIHAADGGPMASLVSGRAGSMLELRHPGDQRSLQIRGGADDGDGPTIVWIAPADPDGEGGDLPRLSMGLRLDGEPYLQINDPQGRAVFTAPRPVPTAPPGR